MMEFFFDTTRAVVSLMLSGTLSKYPNITWNRRIQEVLCLPLSRASLDSRS